MRASPKDIAKIKEVFELGASRRCYNSYRNMVARCTRKTATNYNHYGGRGIRVCKRWNPAGGNIWAFRNFYKDMGNPSKGKSLDRKNTNGHYTKSNCRWAGTQEQLSSRRKYGALATFTPKELCMHILSIGEDDAVEILKHLIKKVAPNGRNHI